MKALHPSDHEIKSAQVPGGLENSVVLSMDEVVTLPAKIPGSSVANDILLELRQNPICPLLVSARAPTDTKAWHHKTHFNFPFFNPVFGGVATTWQESDTHVEPITNGHQFASCFEKWRTTCASVTVELIAPALADQGTVIAAQTQSPGVDYWLASTNMGTGQWAASFPLCTPVRVRLRDPPPTEARMCSSTRAYTAKAKEGVYMPLRIENFDYRSLSQDWVTMDSEMCWDQSPQEFPNTVRSILDYERDCYDTYGTILDNPTKPAWAYIGTVGSNMGFVIFKGLSPDASLRIRVRYCIEATVKSGTPYSSMTIVPPPPDELAMKMYREVAGRMADAYPARFNDWDTLKSTIKKMASALLPLASPGLAMATAGLPFGGAINALGQSALDGVRKWVGNTAPSKAMLTDPAKQAVAALAAAAPVRKKRKRKPRASRTQASAAPKRKLNIVRPSQQ